MSPDPKGSWWIVTDNDRPYGVEGCNAVWVEMDSEGAAAEVGMEVLQEVWERQGEPEPLRHVFVTPGEERTAYEVVSTTVRAELQCCGGLGPEAPERHSAHCPEAPEDLKGLHSPTPEVPE